MTRKKYKRSVRTNRFGLVLSDREKVALERLAENEGGLSLAATVRLLIRAASKEQGLWPYDPKLERSHAEIL